MNGTKICTKCGEELPAITKFFRQSVVGKPWLRGQCKSCESAYKSARRVQQLGAEPLDDDSLMPTGMHKGVRMEDVPAEYLLKQSKNPLCQVQVKAYIEDNLDVLKVQVKRNAKPEPPLYY